MLVRDADGPHRQQNQIAGFPIDLLLVGDGVTFAFENETGCISLILATEK
jgi:hypothetical protein